MIEVHRKSYLTDDRGHAMTRSHRVENILIEIYQIMFDLGTRGIT